MARSDLAEEVITKPVGLDNVVGEGIKTSDVGDSFEIGPEDDKFLDL